MTRLERAALRTIARQLRAAVAQLRAENRELRARLEDPAAEPRGTP